MIKIQKALLLFVQTTATTNHKYVKIVLVVVLSAACVLENVLSSA
jgi:general stress protein CsbA